MERSVRSASAAFSGPSHASARTASPAETAREHQLPDRRVPEFYCLRANLQESTAAGCQIDGIHWDLGAKAKRIGRRRAMRHDRLAALDGQPLDNFAGRWRMGSETALYGQDVHPSPCPKQGTAFDKAGKHLIRRRPTAKMQKLFRYQRSALRQSSSIFQHLFGGSSHDGKLQCGRFMQILLTQVKSSGCRLEGLVPRCFPGLTSYP